MKMTKLHIEGFRSLRDVTWLPGALNVVIGPNGSGKSNLLAFLELIAVSAQGQLGKHVQSSGGMDALVWDGVATAIRCGLDIAPGAINNFPARYDLELLRLGGSSSFRIGTEEFSGAVDGDAPLPHVGGKFLQRSGRQAKFAVKAGQFETLPEDVLADEESLLAMLWPVGNATIKTLRSELVSISIYRNINTSPDAPIRHAAITRMEQRVAPDGQNLISVLHTLYTSDRNFKNDINAAMTAAFGDDFDELVFPPAADQRIQLRVRWRSLKREQSAADLSDGTLRFLYLLAILASPSPTPVIAIDEPETGLHPSMLPVIAEFAMDAATRSQVILTTHSPQMLDAFGATRPTTTVAQWQNGETTLRTIKDADLAYWLKEYSLGALFKSGELEQMA